MLIEEYLRKMLNSGTEEEWKEAMLECSSEEVSDLDTMYSHALEGQISYIREQVSIELESSIHELNFIIKDFLAESKLDFPIGIPLYKDEDEVEVEVENEEHEPIKWETNIKEEFTYL